jgi:hypothetical protein
MYPEAQFRRFLNFEWITRVVWRCPAGYRNKATSAMVFAKVYGKDHAAKSQLGRLTLARVSSAHTSTGWKTTHRTTWMVASSDQLITSNGKFWSKK